MKFLHFCETLDKIWARFLSRAPRICTLLSRVSRGNLTNVNENKQNRRQQRLDLRTYYAAATKQAIKFA